VRSGHVDVLRLLLCHPTPGDPAATPAPPDGAAPALPAALLNRANGDGWTAAHTAAALGLKVRTRKREGAVVYCPLVVGDSTALWWWGTLLPPSGGRLYCPLMVEDSISP